MTPNSFFLVVVEMNNVLFESFMRQNISIIEIWVIYETKPSYYMK